MRVVDLLLEYSLQLRLQTPSTEERLAREVSGCSPTELMDPTPYLEPHALQLNRTVVIDASRHQEIKLLVNVCQAWEEANRADVGRAFQALGLDRRAETTLLVADMRGKFASTSWQLRVALHDTFHTVRVTEFGHRLVAFAQLPRDEYNTVSERLLSIHIRQPLVLSGPTANLDELRLPVVHALDLVQRVDRPQQAPRLGLSSIVTATAGRGACEATDRFLAPFVEHDSRRSSQLLKTLRVYLRHNAQPSLAAARRFTSTAIRSITACARSRTCCTSKSTPSRGRQPACSRYGWPT